MIGDPDLKVAKALTTASRDRVERRQADGGEQRHGAHRLRDRPDKKIKLMLFYPMTTGRNFDDCCACRFHAAHLEAQSRHPGKLEAGPGCHYRRLGERRGREKAVPGSWKAPKPYLRIVPQPTP